MSVSNKPLASKVPQAPAVYGSDSAPIIYFDGFVALGNRDGVMQIELAANHLVPVSLEAGDKVRTKVVITAHLRCSMGAGMALMEALEKFITTAPPLPVK